MRWLAPSVNNASRAMSEGAVALNAPVSVRSVSPVMKIDPIRLGP